MSEFLKLGNNVTPKPQGSDYDLEAGKVYDLMWDDWNSRPIFKLNGSLNLPEKIYQSEEDIRFKNRVLRYFENTNSQNTAVMLAGDKGTGKSITAKVIANESKLPIVIVDTLYPENRLNMFFKQFTTPVCVIFDEIEKNYKTWKMLDFFDGVEATTKKLVLMTCNNLKDVSEYMIDRCSRVRYLRTYKAEDNYTYLNELINSIGVKNPEEVRIFCIKNIAIPSIDNLKAFITEVKTMEDEDVSLEDVLSIMNISLKQNIVMLQSVTKLGEDEDVEEKTQEEVYDSCECCESA
jgi:SpoVK/Ycf46/Vps4 family AAA+-type ATPase